ncbi:hypothetical protein [Paenibacillus ginsengarvi]|uniref:Uncharacterized protein n=1 Tax=Paenibacillus ginsengarvi TaxID=400777 RepID=A0A3B0C3Q3_9BACL|nr:hypothetical protein [Paenibacillus ginsengarvi]RKN79171.1 hypothetical protein D7M11_21050 [Paenibacillus ginsengarvi]
MAAKTSAEIVCTDMDGEAVSYGRQVMRLLETRLQERLYYETSHLHDRPFLKKATHICIASLVPDKLAILKELASDLRTAKFSHDMETV